MNFEEFIMILEKGELINLITRLILYIASNKKKTHRVGNQLYFGKEFSLELKKKKHEKKKRQ